MLRREPRYYFCCFVVFMCFCCFVVIAVGLPASSLSPFTPLSSTNRRVELRNPKEPSEVGRLRHKALEVVDTLPLIGRGV